MDAIKKMLRNKEAQARKYADWCDEDAARLSAEYAEKQEGAATARAEAEEIKRVRIAMYGEDEVSQ